MPVTAAATHVLDEALASGLSDADMASVIRLLLPTTGHDPRATHDDFTEEP